MPHARAFVYLHACALIDGCDCGDHAWEVQPPEGYMFRDTTPYPLPEFATLPEAMNYARHELPNQIIPLPER